GIITNQNMLYNFNTIHNLGGTINNTPNASISNSGSITNFCGGTINNSGSILGNPIINLCKISILSSTNTSPRWGIDAVSVSGNLTSSPSGYSVSVNWGDGTTTNNIGISGNLWGPVFHTYSSGGIATNPNQVVAKLVNSTNF